MATSTGQDQRTQREDFYGWLREVNAAPLWEALDRHTSPYPVSLPWVWRWGELRPALMRAGELVTEDEAERRVLMLINPAQPDRKAAVGVLYAGLQLILPGEVARAHRHTAAALRFIVEGRDAYTVVDGEPLPMSPGDLLLTPNWAWHDHVNEGSDHVVWLDGLDSPLVRALDAWFFELHPEPRQPVTRRADASNERFGQAGLLPEQRVDRAGVSPLLRYPWDRTRRMLEQALGHAPGVPASVEYVDPQTGGPVMPTLRCRTLALEPGVGLPESRRVGSSLWHVVDGAGSCTIGEQSFDVASKDVFAVPSWQPSSVVNTGDEPMFLFCYDDEPVLRALGLDRVEGREAPSGAAT